MTTGDGPPEGGTPNSFVSSLDGNAEMRRPHRDGATYPLCLGGAVDYGITVAAKTESRGNHPK
jgi:hypothetical protein